MRSTELTEEMESCVPEIKQYIQKAPEEEIEKRIEEEFFGKYR